MLNELGKARQSDECQHVQNEKKTIHHNTSIQIIPDSMKAITKNRYTVYRCCNSREILQDIANILKEPFLRKLLV